MRYKKLISPLLVSIIFFILGNNILKNWSAITHYHWQFNFFNSLALLFLLVGIYFVNGLSWFLVYRSMGIKITYFKSLKILLLGNVARFIPGGVWQYASRAFLAKQEKIDGSITATAILIETIFTLSVGVILVSTIGLFWRLPVSYKSLELLLSIIFLLILIVFLLRNKKFTSYLLKIIQKFTRKGKITSINIPPHWVVILGISYLLQFLIDGSVLFFLISNVIVINFQDFFAVIGIFTISWLLGFISFFAPSGLGVQEITLAGMLSFYIPLSLAPFIAIIFRVVLLISEALMILFVLIRDKYLTNR